ncbi:DUF4349 domain-containing protein [uncultured Streptomyces sp.]|uniref:DUF4349 domain-containing protein n=1 Tax=uncultured Streptomyces sp. TaxID=174707 RepID=UPI00260F3315|nr:DUF4349 domain-containing protein [uncultured Streptomyces sp.]
MGASSGDSKPAFSGRGVAGGERADDTAGAKEGSDGAKPDGTAKKAAVSQVIRTASLSVRVKDVPKAVAAARRAAEGSGGLVQSETTERVDDAYDTSTLVLRVPEDRYQRVLSDLAGAGKLLSRSSEAKDVTDQVVDVESRIATQRASVDRVRAMMDKAEKLSDVVLLEGELSSRQSELESLLAQQATLKDRTSLATITLDLYEPEAVPDDAADDDPGFLDALEGGWNAFVTMLRWIAVSIGASAPFLAALALLYALVRAVSRRRRAAGPAADTDDAPAASRAPAASGAPARPVAADADGTGEARDTSAG